MIDVAGKTFLTTADNAVVGVYPLDYIAWTRDLDQNERVISSAIEKLAGAKSKRLIVYGTVDPQARSVLESRGWSMIVKTIEPK